jgi:cytochrome oxidase Cu insertion factor (SCO1/SenC/PrrC family)
MALARRSSRGPARAIEFLTRWAAALALLAAVALVPSAAAHQTEAIAALGYEPPAPGTYRLHRIMAAPNGTVLDVDGRARPLSHFLHDSITLLGFIYTTCVDPDGCPLAYRVFDALKESIVATPALNGRVRLVTLSFDPARDTPTVMRRYAGSRVRDEGRGLSWYFLTTRSVRELVPLVDGFGQDVRYSVDPANGRTRRELSHVLKVFLIDRAGSVREIYSSAFLHPRVVLNDIETLLMEDGRATSPAAPPRH